MSPSKNSDQANMLLAQRLTVEEVAQRLSRPAAAIMEMVRRFQFPRILLKRKSVRQGKAFPYYECLYFDPVLWPHGEKQKVFPHGLQGGFYDRLIDPADFPLGFELPTQSRVFIFWEDAMIDIPLPVKGGTKLQRIINECWDALSKEVKKPGRTHKQRVHDWLQRHYPNKKDLSKNEREKIAVVLNEKPEGGAPKQ